MIPELHQPPSVGRFVSSPCPKLHQTAPFDFGQADAASDDLVSCGLLISIEDYITTEAALMVISQDLMKRVTILKRWI